MNKQEYKRYEKKVEEFMRVNELNNLTRISFDSEPYFSRTPCECCGTHLGGNRIDASGYSRTGEVYEFSICTDCEYYAEYWQLDDETMMNMESD